MRSEMGHLFSTPRNSTGSQDKQPHAENWMATSTIPNPNQIVRTSLGVSGYTQQVTYHKRAITKYNGNRVHIELSCSFEIDIPTGTSIVTVPNGYRPSQNVTIPAIMKTDSGAIMCSIFTINASSGMITQGDTGHMRSCYMDGWYNI